jgi:hypothetical protein
MWTIYINITSTQAKGGKTRFEVEIPPQLVGFMGILIIR